MNLKLIKKNDTEIDANFCSEISGSLKIHPKLVELLFSRGFDSKVKINNFLYPSMENFHDPFLLKGMKEAVERIKIAINNDEKVVIYGDYDADGICAASILSLFLADSGLNVYTHIPSRSGEGYGLNIESLEKIIETACPDLILTCDCGISAYKEVEFITELGVDVIVTDHHEISETLPQCIIVNPKQIGCNYPIDYLCGAGVALKLVAAIGGESKAMEYLDLAAIATVADLVPLLDENRLIVQLGLKNIKNLGLKALLKNQQLGTDITSGDIAFKIAPRINAAGRMGDAYRAFEMLVTKDAQQINLLINDINEDNNKRKTLCDEIYCEAMQIIRNEDIVNSRAIILSHPNWEKGITGILAARIAGDFKRPSFILVNSGDSYKGTSRSIAGINVYELLSSVSDILIEFGGHSQAAGFSIEKNNIDEFKKRVNKYLLDFDESYFLPYLDYDLDINLNEINLSLAKSLVNIEPFGNSNLRPIFRTVTRNLDVSSCKNISHTSITTENGLNILAFNFYNQNNFLLGQDDKEIALEVQLNNFAGKESIKAILKDVSPSSLNINDEIAKANFIKNLAFTSNKEPKFEQYNKDDLISLIDGNIYGTLIICGCKKTYEEIPKEIADKMVINEFFYSTLKNNYSRIIVSPIFDENLMLSNYNKIVFLDSPFSNKVVSYINGKTEAVIYLPKENNEKYFLKNIQLSREIFGFYFDSIRRNQEIISNNIFSYFDVLSSKVENLNLSQFIVCFMIFKELDFLSISKDNFSIHINKGEKKNLDSSTIFCYIKERI